MRHTRQEFCNIIFAAVKFLSPRRCRNNYRPCWHADAECEYLYQVFLRALQGETTSSVASALLSHLDEKRNNRWSEAVININLTHFSRLAWNIIINLTGRTRHTCRLCSITANLIASQLVKNRIYKTTNRDSARKKSHNSGGFQHHLTIVSPKIFLRKNLPLPSSC